MCETFTQALVAVHDAERELPLVPIAWLVTIARNTLIDSVRRGRVADDARQRLAMQPLDIYDSDIEALENAATDADLMAELEAALPAAQLHAFVARVLEEREYDEIAADLQTSPSVVRKRVSRAVARLRMVREK
jgi:RNA polymerase sigma factor (sigma-70 family)